MANVAPVLALFGTNSPLDFVPRATPPGRNPILALSSRLGCRVVLLTVMAEPSVFLTHSTVTEKGTGVRGKGRLVLYGRRSEKDSADQILPKLVIVVVREAPTLPRSGITSISAVHFGRHGHRDDEVS